MAKPVLLLGSPTLRLKSEAVCEFASASFKGDIADLKEALEDFRARNGFGRGIAAIQIGIARRMIALNLGGGPFVIVNPRIVRRSPEAFRMWDDCMSFPDLVVRVERHRSIDVEYLDEGGNRKEWPGLDQATSELLQHEIDHLDGVLAIDRAIEASDIIYKAEYSRNRAYYDTMVDYAIRPTIAAARDLEMSHELY
jgi:peptide deformylase